jgi:hypothetical protein
MNEFKLPLKKIWQLGSKNAELVRPVVTTGSPTGAPTAVGITWICTEGPLIYISTGTSSVADWSQITLV